MMFINEAHLKRPLWGWQRTTAAPRGGGII
jgi:hypothetical protein